MLEELLRDAAADRLLTGARVVAIDQDEDRVSVTVADSDGHRTQVTANYALGCDGPRSAVRTAIGSAYVGEQALRPNLGMVFVAPGLRPRHGPAVQYWTVNPLTPALMGPIDLQGTWWIIAMGKEPDADPQAVIEGAAGQAVDATVLSTDPWTARMQLVDRVRGAPLAL